MPQQLSHSDPLLEFSTEFGEPAPALPEPGQVVETLLVAETPSAVAAAPEDLEALRGRVDQLEKALAQTVEDLSALRSEVATLVTVAGNIRQQPARSVVVPFPSVSATPRTTRAVSAIAGIVLGVAIGLWFWRATDSAPLAPSAPVAIASERAAAPTPAAPAGPAPVAQPVTATPAPATQPVKAPPAPAAIIPAAVVTPARSAPERSPRRVEYVGTLTIDSDPAGDVSIDRKPAGRTPLRAADLKAGSHLIWIEKDGYRRFTRVVQVPADRVTRLVAELEPVPR